MGKFINENSPLWGFVKWLRTLLDRSGSLFWANLLAMTALTPSWACLFFYGEKRNPLLLCGAVLGFALASPALTALFFQCMQAVRENPMWVWDSFRDAYRKEFRKSFGFGLLVALLWMAYFWAAALVLGDGIANIVSLVGMTLSGVLLSGFSFFLFQQMATVELSWQNVLRNGLLLVLAGKGRSLVVSLGAFAVVAASIWFSYLSWFVLMLGALALLVMTGELIFYPVFETLFLEVEN